MEAISNSLQPYKEIVGSIASVLTIIQFFSGAFICRDIQKNKSTAGVASTPFVGGVVIGILVLKYAVMLDDQAMFQVNMAAIVLNSMYLICYYLYCEDKWDSLYKPCLRGTALIAALSLYIEWEDKGNLEFRYGLIVTVLMLALIGSPLMEMKEIIENEDASSIPFPITFMGFFVSLLWLLYGIILYNEFMIIQNVIGTILCAAQLVLCYKYPGHSHSD